MKIIFLDFDGVVSTYEKRWHLDPAKLTLVNTIVWQTDARIVVTSSWKVGKRKVDDFKEELFGSFLVDDKNNEAFKRFVKNIYDITDSKGPDRGSEIQRWLDAHEEEVENYVILDDDSDMLEDQLFNFVQTDTYEGITEREVKLCKKVLTDKVISPSRLNLVLTCRWRNECRGLENTGIREKIQEYRNNGRTNG